MILSCSILSLSTRNLLNILKQFILFFFTKDSFLYTSYLNSSGLLIIVKLFISDLNKKSIYLTISNFVFQNNNKPFISALTYKFSETIFLTNVIYELCPL